MSQQSQGSTVAPHSTNSRPSLEPGPLRREISVKRKSGTLNDWYSITSQEAVAKGAFGRIFIGKSKNSSDKVAIKEIPFKNVEQKSTFEKELAIAKLLKHPNIIRLHDTITDDTNEIWYLVMELCAGGDLFQLVQKKKLRGGIPEKNLAKYAYEMLDGINYCHHHNFCHRDIKAENYMLHFENERSTLKLIDFGLACSYTTGEPMTEMVGTVQQIAPEVLEESYTEKVDIWSIGITLYILVTSFPPFSAGGKEEALIMLLRKGPNINVPFMVHQAVWKKVNKDKKPGETGAEELIREMLTVDPEARPSATYLLENNRWLQMHASSFKSDMKCCSLQ